MTSEEILAMKPGRDLDRLIAEVVLGLTLEEGKGLFQKSPMLKIFLSEEEFNKPNLVIKDERYIISGGQREIPKYSNSISEAWGVVDNFKDKEVTVKRYEGMDSKFRYVCWIVDDFIDIQQIAFTAPEAICKAALLAVLESTP